MNEGILRKIRLLARARAYTLSRHAEKEAWADGLGVDDLEHALEFGHLAERQRDRGSGEWKYLVEGPTLDGGWMVVVVKFSARDTLYLVTVFRLDGGTRTP